MTPTERARVATRWPALVALAVATACGSEAGRHEVAIETPLPATQPDLDSLEQLVDSLAHARDSVAPWYGPRPPQRQADVAVDAPTLMAFYPDLAHAEAGRDPEVIVAVHAFRPTLTPLAELAERNAVVFLERFVPLRDESFRIHDRTKHREIHLTVPPDGIGYVLLRPGRRPRVHLGEIPMAEWQSILTDFLAHDSDYPVLPAS